LKSLTTLSICLAAACLVSGCGSSASPSASAGGYWSRERLLAAQPWRYGEHGNALPSPNPSPTAHSTLRALRVGALFSSGSGGNHFCTASVVNSPGHNLLITAAHCINNGNGNGYRSNIVFIPAYADGNEPFGVWQPEKLLVDPRWASSSDEDLDVGFIVLKPLNGKNIQDVLGGDNLAINPGFTNVVRVTGYPSSASEAVTCVNKTSQQATYQVRFDCDGYPNGTSGSPWVTHFNEDTRQGDIVGVIGGYQAGGDTDSISYSSYFDSDIENLYKQATGS
jgi:V8-like Glu-specific endopeptidase